MTSSRSLVRPTYVVGQQHFRECIQMCNNNNNEIAGSVGSVVLLLIKRRGAAGRSVKWSLRDVALLVGAVSGAVLQQVDDLVAPNR